MKRKLRSPFPWFGSKHQVADLVWERFGRVENYVEPFAGSLAVLIANPEPAKVETVNDTNCHLVNFFRAVAHNPGEVAGYADYPVTEVDLHARHAWLVAHDTETWRDQLRASPEFFDARVAGWWVWGVSASVGDNFLQTKGARAAPALSSAGYGIHRAGLDVQDLMQRLSRRLRRVRVLCRDWRSVVSPAITYRNKGLGREGVIAVFLDPPYPDGSDLAGTVLADVLGWAIAAAEKPRLRIAVCLPEMDIKPPDGWNVVPWKRNGGYGNRGGGERRRELIWFSPQCAPP
jgi:hypothetical protein